MNIPDEAVEAAAEAIRSTAKTHPRPRSMDGPMQLARDQARAALEAAWGVIHPVLTTAEELDALPTDSVVRDARGRVWEIYNDDDGDDPAWDLLGVAYDEHIPTSAVMEFPPFTVIYRPSKEQS